MENKLGRRAALVTPTPLAGDSLPEPQGSAFPWLLLSLHSQRQAACNPTATPKALCFSGPHANPKYQRHDSQVPGPEGLPEHPAAHRTSRLLTRAPPSGVGRSQLLHSLPRGCPRNTPLPAPHDSNLRVHCGTFLFSSQRVAGAQRSHRTVKKTKFVILKNWVQKPYIN